MKKVKEEYVPIDFMAYTIEDSASSVLKKVKADDAAEHYKESRTKNVDPNEKLWRISSLTASVDDETKILVVPVPESKRSVKVADTRYEAKTYGDLMAAISGVHEQLSGDVG